MSSTVLLAHTLSALQATSSSIEQFFPPIWGPLDTVLLLLMWLAPLVALVIVRCEYTIEQFIAVLVRWFLPQFGTLLALPAYQELRGAFWNVEVPRSSLYRYRHLNRGPPSLVV